MKALPTISSDQLQRAAFSTIEFYAVFAGRRGVCRGSGGERGEYQVLQRLSCYYHHTGMAFHPILPSTHTPKTTGWHHVLQLCPLTRIFQNHKEFFLPYFCEYTSQFSVGGLKLPNWGLKTKTVFHWKSSLMHWPEASPETWTVSSLYPSLL